MKATTLKLVIAQTYTAVCTLILIACLWKAIENNNFGKLFAKAPGEALLVSGLLVFFAFIIAAAADKCRELIVRGAAEDAEFEAYYQVWNAAREQARAEAVIAAEEDGPSFDDEGRPELSDAMRAHYARLCTVCASEDGDFATGYCAACHEPLMDVARDEHAVEYEREHFGYNGHPTSFPDGDEDRASAQVEVALFVGRAKQTADHTQISEWATPSAPVDTDLEAVFEARHWAYVHGGGKHVLTTCQNIDLPYLSGN